MARTRHGIVSAFLLAVIAASLPAGGAHAADKRLDLPLKAPPQAHPLVTDFVEVCSEAMTSLSGAFAEAQKRGWVTATDNTPFGSASAIALGVATLAKTVDDQPIRFIMTHNVYPHLVTSSCTLQMLRSVPVGLDTSVVGRIDGVATGDPPVPGLGIGRWSFLDSDGVPVSIGATPLPSTKGLLLFMGRSQPNPDRKAAP